MKIILMITALTLTACSSTQKSRKIIMTYGEDRKIHSVECPDEPGSNCGDLSLEWVYWKLRNGEKI